jgi:hypothetical protein
MFTDKDRASLESDLLSVLVERVPVRLPPDVDFKVPINLPVHTVVVPHTVPGQLLELSVVNPDGVLKKLGVPRTRFKGYTVFRFTHTRWACLSKKGEFDTIGHGTEFMEMAPHCITKPPHWGIWFKGGARLHLSTDHPVGCATFYMFNILKLRETPILDEITCSRVFMY